MLTKPPVPYDLCVADPISRWETVGSTPDLECGGHLVVLQGEDEVVGHAVLGIVQPVLSQPCLAAHRGSGAGTLHLAATLPLPCHYLATPFTTLLLFAITFLHILLPYYSRYHLPPVYLKKAGEQRVSLGYCSGDSVTRDTDTFCGRTG